MGESKRITLVSPYDPTPDQLDTKGAKVGGVERVFAEVAKGLVARGHDVTMLCSTSGPPRRTVDDNLRTIRVHRHATLFRDPVCRLDRHLPPGADIVHVAATYPFTTAPVLRRADRDGAVPVLDFHFEPHPGSAAGRLAAALYRKVGPPSYSVAQAVLVRSHAYAESAPSLAGVPAERLRIVPNGIDPARFRPDGPASPGDYLLFVGRLVPYKGVEVLLHAMALARLGLPLVVVGDGPRKPFLESLARNLGVEVRWLGHIPDDMLPILYRGATLTVLPSVNRQEAFGIALIESMACGTPVVASALRGVEDVAKVGGLTVPPGDPAALAQALQQAIAANLPRGAALARKVHALFSWDAVTDRLVQVYDEALAGRPRREVNPHAHPGGHAVL
ncbi:MAG: hypothetical protein QOD77_723 [Thermoplasmata archaeon]|nr:hypothetical protein [Thermoplasmata archaeon]